MVSGSSSRPSRRRCNPLGTPSHLGILPLGQEAAWHARSIRPPRGAARRCEGISDERHCAGTGNRRHFCGCADRNRRMRRDRVGSAGGRHTERGHAYNVSDAASSRRSACQPAGRAQSRGLAIGCSGGASPSSVSGARSGLPGTAFHLARVGYDVSRRRV
jgi:hypothetical protein